MKNFMLKMLLSVQLKFKKKKIHNSQFKLTIEGINTRIAKEIETIKIRVISREFEC